LQADGVPRLDKGACRYVFERIGVKDTVVADRIFSTWDTDGTGSIDMKEFLHALVLVLRGSHHEKLEMAFTIMDMDNDGTCIQKHTGNQALLCMKYV
jgi:Ca2+-binding EF-hand superfamily protein